MAEIFSPGGGSIIVVLVIAGFALSIWAIVDAALMPTEAFKVAGSSKAMWISLIAIFYLLTLIGGLILAVVYFVAVRSRVASHLPS